MKKSIKNKLMIVIGILMVSVIIGYIVTNIKLSQSKKKNTIGKSSQKEEMPNIDMSNLSEYEKNVLISTRLSELKYLGEPIKSVGYIIKVNSCVIQNGIHNIEEIKGYQEYFKNNYGSGEGKSVVVVDIEITNENADSFFEGQPKVDLCLGNLFLVLLDENGKESSESEMFICSNDKNDPMSKSGYNYPLNKGETYKGKLVYIIWDGINTSNLGLSIDLFGISQESTENKIILLSKRNK